MTSLIRKPNLRTFQHFGTLRVAVLICLQNQNQNFHLNIVNCSGIWLVNKKLKRRPPPCLILLDVNARHYRVVIIPGIFGCLYV